MSRRNAKPKPAYDPFGFQPEHLQQRDDEQDRQAAMARGPDWWANIDTSAIEKLGPNQKRAALEAKRILIDKQKLRYCIENGLKEGNRERAVREGWVDTWDGVEEYAAKVLEGLNIGKQFVALYTFGKTAGWEKKCREAHGEVEFPTQADGGVNVISMNLIGRNGIDIPACLHVGKVFADEKGGKPFLPKALAAIFHHPNAIFIGEDVSSHLERVERSFFGELNGPFYLTLSNLVQRCVWLKTTHIRKFLIDPFSNFNLMADYHRMSERGDTYQLDVFARFDDWNRTGERLHEPQVAYARAGTIDYL